MDQHFQVILTFPISDLLEIQLETLVMDIRLYVMELQSMEATKLLVLGRS